MDNIFSCCIFRNAIMCNCAAELGCFQFNVACTFFMFSVSSVFCSILKKCFLSFNQSYVIIILIVHIHGWIWSDVASGIILYLIKQCGPGGTMVTCMPSKSEFQQNREWIYSYYFSSNDTGSILKKHTKILMSCGIFPVKNSV